MKRKHFFTVCLLLAILLYQNAFGEWALPSGLSEIGEEAFMGIPLPSALNLPAGMTKIGDRAFKNCGTLHRITIPDTVNEIGEDVFLGCGSALLINCSPGSSALSFAKSNGYDWHADTVCRALIIGQSYPNSSRKLYGTLNDMRAVNFCLSNLQGTQYATTMKSNLTADQIISNIKSTFAGATENDISYLHYSGHGEEDGSLLGTDFRKVSPSALRTALDTIPGRKVVIIDACFSANLISNSGTLKSSRGTSPSESFVANFQAAFAQRSRGALNTNMYYVITAAGVTEECEEGYIDKKISDMEMGFFTYGYCKGCGWDALTNQTCQLYADKNQDGAVSLYEAYVYANAFAKSINDEQTAAVWPSNCTWFSPLRMY